MISKAKAFRYIILAMTVLASPLAYSQDSKSGLISKNPFFPHDWRKNVRKPPSAPVKRPQPPPMIELRGIMKISGVRQFSIYNKRTNKGSWMSLGQKLDEGSSVVLASYDAGNKKLTLLDGRNPPIIVGLKAFNSRPLEIASDIKKPDNKTTNRVVTDSGLPPELEKRISKLTPEQQAKIRAEYKLAKERAAQNKSLSGRRRVVPPRRTITPGKK